MSTIKGIDDRVAARVSAATGLLRAIVKAHAASATHIVIGRARVGVPLCGAKLRGEWRWCEVPQSDELCTSCNLRMSALARKAFKIEAEKLSLRQLKALVKKNPNKNL